LGNGRGEGGFGRGVDVEAVGETELGFEIVVLDGRGFGGVVGVGAGLPGCGTLEVAGGVAQADEDFVGALGVDHVSGESLKDMGDGGLHGLHVFQGWQLQVEAQAAGAILGRAELAGAVLEVEDAIVAPGDGRRFADVSVVVEMIAGFVVAQEAPQKLPVASRQLPEKR